MSLLDENRLISVTVVQPVQNREKRDFLTSFLVSTPRKPSQKAFRIESILFFTKKLSKQQKWLA